MSWGKEVEFWRRVLTLFLSYVLVVIKRLRAINEKTAQSLLFVIAVKRRYSVGPIVSEIANERSDVKVGKINVDEQPELAAQFQVMSIPMLAVIKNGRLENQVVGYRSKEQIEAML